MVESARVDDAVEVERDIYLISRLLVEPTIQIVYHLLLIGFAHFFVVPSHVDNVAKLRFQLGLFATKSERV
jgi:hypothetical protein